jgi:hypothetical protein
VKQSARSRKVDLRANGSPDYVAGNTRSSILASGGAIDGCDVQPSAKILHGQCAFGFRAHIN